MTLRLNVESLGEDPSDHLVRYVCKIENDAYKGTSEFFEYADVFRGFAHDLLNFPFVCKKPVCLDIESQGLYIEVSLGDAAGMIVFSCRIADEDECQLVLTDTSLELEGLHRVARKLSAADFSSPGVYEYGF